MTKTITEATPNNASRPPRARRSQAKIHSAPTTSASTTNAKTSAQLKRPTRSSFLIELMSAETGETAQTLAEAVGWQVHSVRGFISGTLKKRTDLEVIATKRDGVTRYAVRHLAAPGA